MGQRRHISQKTSGSVVPAAVLVIIAAVPIAFIIFNSCQDTAASWELSGSVSEIFAPFLETLYDEAIALFGWTGNTVLDDYGVFVRKTAHFIEYGVLGFACAAIAVISKKRIVSELLWMTAFVPLATAVVDEFIQSFSGRTSQVSDILLDYTGACTGALVALAIFGILFALRKRP